MTSRSIQSVPQLYARTAGVLYLLVIGFGGFSEGYVANTLIVSGDPAATAHNIMAAAGLWRISVAGNLIVPLIAILQLWIEYLLLKPASKNLALLFIFFTIASLSVEAVSKLFLLIVLPFLENPRYYGAFSSQQTVAIVHIYLAAHDIAFNIALLFFGCACIIEGYLIYISGYLPKLVGLLLQIAGVCYLMASFSALCLPAVSDMISPTILIPPLIGELSLALWLVVKGVNVREWQARTSLLPAR
jgi:hypothetical protein